MDAAQGRRTPMDQLALSATVSTSHCSPWEKLEALNDGKVAAVSMEDPDVSVYGNWRVRQAMEAPTGYSTNGPMLTK